MGEGLSAIIATNAALSASKTVLESVQNWNSRSTPEFITRRAFKRMIDKNTVLGFHEHLRLQRYAPTPILDAMCNCRGRGKVFVAMVPSGLGKTTAAKQFLHQFKEKRQGIAICGQSGTDEPYVRSMLAALGMDPINPPKGWLKCLVNALDDADNACTRKPFLVLDDFGGDEFVTADASLIITLKSQVRNTKVSVIVLTNTKEYADFLLSKNQLQGIVPVTGTYPDFRDIYPNGEWMSMRWSINTYKMSARHQPNLAQFSTAQINDAIDEYVRGLTQEKFDQMTPLILWEELENILSPEMHWRAAPDITSSGEGEEIAGCAQCVVS